MAESLYLLILNKDIHTSAAHSYLRLSVILMQKASLHYTRSVHTIHYVAAEIHMTFRSFTLCEKSSVTS